jgi:lectin-like protein
MYLGRRWYSAAIKKAETPSNYKKVYSYDISGWVDNFGWGRNVGWMANMFTAGSSESVQAVSFYACGSSNNYAVYVYRGCTVGQPRSGVFVTKKSGKLSAPGYYTIKLKKKVAVSKGQRFSVVVKLITSGSDYPIPCEVRTKGYTKVKYSKSSKNQSFLSPNGTDWTDLIEEAKNANVCLKAFVK